MAIIVSVLRFVLVTGTGDRAVSSGFAHKVSLALLLGLVGLVGPGASPLARAQTFGDVPTNHWAYAFIEELADRGVTSGCGDGDYCPDAVVTRAQMAVFLIRAMATARVIDGNGDEIGSFIDNSGDGGSVESTSVLTEQGYLIRSLIMGSGDHNPTALFYPGPNCTGTPHVDKHAGSIVKNGSALFYVDLNAVAVADFAAASISFSEGGCSNGALGVQYAWPAVPNVPSVTGVPGAAYVTPITIDWR